MIVHDEGESDAGSTPCKDSTLIVRQVLAKKKKKKKKLQKSDEALIPINTFHCSVVVFFHSYPMFFHFVFML